MPGKRLAYYITPHGFGHAVRSLEIIRALRERLPGVRITAVSDLPDFLFEEAAGGPVPQRRKRLDVGMVQLDSLRFDLAATRQALAGLLADYNALVDGECAFLKEGGFDGLISDAGFLPFTAAKRAKLPSIGVGNFTWDWIYEPFVDEYPGLVPVIFRIRNEYAKCGLFLELPLNGDCSVFPRREKTPLVARRAVLDRNEVLRLLGHPEDKKAVLVSFTDLDLSPEAASRLEKIKDTVFYYKKPLRLSLANARSLDDCAIPYQDVVAAMDAVVTKPGYGVASDCLAHETPMVYCDRGPFREYDVLVREIEANLAAVHLPADDLRAGNWAQALARLAGLPRKKNGIPLDGAAFCARRISEEFGLE